MIFQVVFFSVIFCYCDLQCLVYVGILFKSFRPSEITTIVSFK